MSPRKMDSYGLRNFWNLPVHDVSAQADVEADLVVVC